MELNEAITTIRALADGLNPTTREALDAKPPAASHSPSKL